MESTKTTKRKSQKLIKSNLLLRFKYYNIYKGIKPSSNIRQHVLNEDIQQNIPIPRSPFISKKNENYWNWLIGLNIQMKPKNRSVLDHVISVNEEYFNTLHKYKSFSVSIDGMPAVGKTTITNLKTDYGLNMNGGKNFHIASACSYVNAGYCDRISINRATLKTYIFDRTYINNFIWCIGWMALSFLKINNLLSDNLEFKPEYFSELETIWNCSTIYNATITSPIIFLVDSNETNALERIKKRNEGSDSIRCNWKNYALINNWLYGSIYSKYKSKIIFIDVSWFKDLDELHSTLNYLILDLLHRSKDYYAPSIEESRQPVDIFIKTPKMITKEKQDSEKAQIFQSLYFSRYANELLNF